jgi:hypothetical protein
MPGLVTEDLQARFLVAALDLEHLRQLELGQPWVEQIEGDSDARNTVRAEPLIGDPVMRAREPTRSQLAVDTLDPLLKLAPLDVQIEIAQADVEQLLVGERGPVWRYAAG